MTGLGLFPQGYVGADIVKTVSRLLRRSVYESDDLRNQTFEAFKDAFIQECLTDKSTKNFYSQAGNSHTNEGLFIAGFQISGTGIAVGPPTDSAVLPAWRDTSTRVIIGSEWKFTSSWDVVNSSSLFVT